MARKRILGTLALVYLTLLLAKRMAFPLPNLVSSYLADLLCLPLLLSCALLSVRYLMRKPTLLLSTAHVLFVFAYVSCVFEYLLPFLSARYIADPVDLLCYALGAIVFWRFQKIYFNTAALSEHI